MRFFSGPGSMGVVTWMQRKNGIHNGKGGRSLMTFDVNVDGHFDERFLVKL